jgi:hypothetical protein
MSLESILPVGAPLTTQYDYPNDVAESVNDLSHQAASAWATFANKNLKVSRASWEI